MPTVSPMETSYAEAVQDIVNEVGFRPMLEMVLRRRPEVFITQMVPAAMEILRRKAGEGPDGPTSDRTIILTAVPRTKLSE